MGDAKACGRPIIIGGDFNSQLGIGIRGELLNAFAVWNGLLVANGMTCENDGDSWTFESTMGIRRRIDFMLLSQELLLVCSQPTDDIDLGSDHRAVFAQTRVPEKVLQRPRRQAPWKWFGSSSYKAKLTDSLNTSCPETVEDIQRLTLDAALESGALLRSSNSGREWDTQELKDLRDERRRCRVKSVRSSLSKLIQ